MFDMIVHAVTSFGETCELYLEIESNETADLQTFNSVTLSQLSGGCSCWCFDTSEFMNTNLTAIKIIDRCELASLTDKFTRLT